MIITVSPREQRGQTVNNFYGYNAGLNNSVEKNFLEKKILETTVDSFPQDSIQIESQTQMEPEENEILLASNTKETLSVEEPEIIQRR